MAPPFRESLCHRCAAVRYVRGKRGAVFLMCTARPEKYLPQPVRDCPVFTPAERDEMKLNFPATERNRAPILEVLRDVLPREGLVLEIASGSGQHVVHFAAALPGLEFQPTDVDPAHLASIRAWIAETGVENVRPPLALDVVADAWPVARADAIFCANMIHIAPWEACLGLLAGAGRALPAGAPLCLYGPFRFGGEYTADSNAAFDRSLKGRDPSWGVRDLDDVEAAAAPHGLVKTQVVALPANNHVVVFRRQSADL